MTEAQAEIDRDLDDEQWREWGEEDFLNSLDEEFESDREYYRDFYGDAERLWRE